MAHGILSGRWLIEPCFTLLATLWRRCGIGQLIEAGTATIRVCVYVCVCVSAGAVERGQLTLD